MAILSEKRQKCFGLRRKDVRMRAIICDDDGRFAKKLEQLIMKHRKNLFRCSFRFVTCQNVLFLLEICWCYLETW